MGTSLFPNGHLYLHYPRNRRAQFFWSPHKLNELGRVLLREHSLPMLDSRSEPFAPPVPFSKIGVIFRPDDFEISTYGNVPPIEYYGDSFKVRSISAEGVLISVEDLTRVEVFRPKVGPTMLDLIADDFSRWGARNWDSRLPEVRRYWGR